MSLIRRDPFALDLASLFARPVLAWPDWLGEQLEAVAERQHIPVEEFVEEGTHVIRAELPGVDPERDVEITVQDGILRIRAERRESEREEKAGFIRSELRYGAFARTIPLPSGCDESDVSAAYADGILTIRLPLGEEKTAATKVPVTRG
jgi:HSP20 family protein